ALVQSPPPENSAPAEDSSSMEPPLVGDHWTYEIRDEIAGALKYTTVARYHSGVAERYRYAHRKSRSPGIRLSSLRPCVESERQLDLEVFPGRRHRHQNASEGRQ